MSCNGMVVFLFFFLFNIVFDVFFFIHSKFKPRVVFFVKNIDFAELSGLG